MVKREVHGNRRDVEMRQGTLLQKFPDIRIQTEKEMASLTLKGGLGSVPVTFIGLSSPSGYELKIDGVILDQSVHGKDFWQTNFDSVTSTWSRTYNLPISDQESHLIELSHF